MSHLPPSNVLVIGSGAAGLSLALRLAENGIASTILSKDKLSSGSTLHAQGGISAVLDEQDSMDSHVQDTLDAGAGLCNEDVVRYTVERGPESIAWLQQQGVAFTEGDAGLHLTREGGHSHRRV
ncbi:MAG: FAD-dependent oxidoreductase, partial [Salinisphaeraceae bacterium]|nr:FAD-dependent oxidoreductase [Salinisphaeraceae bacterium]